MMFLKIGGVILAAGASSRMGQPKALLKDRSRQFLARRQVNLLQNAGCFDTVVVAGADYAVIRDALVTDCRIVNNPRWQEGRITSLQEGIRSLAACDGWLILPVDAVGIQVSTIWNLLQEVHKIPNVIWRPYFHGEKGHILFLPYGLKDEILSLSPGIRVDEWAEPLVQALDVEDPAILHNMNTPEEWAIFLAFLPSQLKKGNA